MLIKWADAQADLSLRWAKSHFVGFVMSRLKLSITVSVHCNTILALLSQIHRKPTAVFNTAWAIISARPRAAEYTIGICKEKAKKHKVSKWLIPSGSQCKHFFHHQCREPFILKSRRSLAVLRSGQSILLFQNSHGLTGILHSVVTGFSGLVVRC